MEAHQGYGSILKSSQRRHHICELETIASENLLTDHQISCHTTVHSLRFSSVKSSDTSTSSHPQPLPLNSLSVSAGNASFCSADKCGGFWFQPHRLMGLCAYSGQGWAPQWSDDDHRANRYQPCRTDFLSINLQFFGQSVGLKLKCNHPISWAWGFILEQHGLFRLQTTSRDSSDCMTTDQVRSRNPDWGLYAAFPQQCCPDPRQEAISCGCFGLFLVNENNLMLWTCSPRR